MEGSQNMVDMTTPWEDVRALCGKEESEGWGSYMEKCCLEVGWNLLGWFTWLTGTQHWLILLVRTSAWVCLMEQLTLCNTTVKVFTAPWMKYFGWCAFKEYMKNGHYLDLSWVHLLADLNFMKIGSLTTQVCILRKIHFHLKPIWIFWIHPRMSAFKIESQMRTKPVTSSCW